MSNKCQKLPSSALSRLLAHIEKHTIAQVPHREGFFMSGEAISTAAHRMINDALRTSRRRFLTQVGAAGLGIGVPMSTTIAQETQRSSVGDGKEVSLGEKLARYATSLRYEDLPEEVIRLAKRSILDTVGCAFGGYSAGPSKIGSRHHSSVSRSASAVASPSAFHLANFPKQSLKPPWKQGRISRVRTKS